MEEKLSQFKQIAAEAFDLTAAAYVLSWDQQVNMPPGGAEARGNQMATLMSLAHQKSTSEDVGALLEELVPYAEAELEPDSDDARMIQVANKLYQRDARVPSSFIAERAKTVAMAHAAWEKAREEKNFTAFQPHLEKIVDLYQQYVEYFKPYDHVYDPLLDNFEPGMKTADVQRIFNDLRPRQVELIKAIADQPQVDDSFLHQYFEPRKQWDFGEEVITKYGYDWSRGRQDKAVHPFTIGFGVNDVRITTRVRDDFLNPALFGTMHESGHAMYGQGIAQHLDRTVLMEGASLGIHESQSRMFENLIGRSKDFWMHFYPRLQEVFPSQLGSVDLETFYKGINKVAPSLIRVEADEATYNLHIMLRMELEIAMMEGSLAIKDLPEAWNSRMEDYLGLTPPDDALGVLQDVHWSDGYIGYFSTYALGNLISMQLWEKMEEDMPTIHDQIRTGEFGEILGWLRENVHRHGRKYEPKELVQKITGGPINSDPYMRYLKTKYSAIYSL